MAVQALTAEYLALNGSAALNTFVKSAALAVDVDQLDSTAMGPGWKAAIGGLKAGTLTVTFNDDVASGSVDATLWPLLGTVVTFEIRLNDTAVSTSNPKYTGSILISQHNLGGGVGELAATQLTFQTSGAVTRATS